MYVGVHYWGGEMTLELVGRAVLFQERAQHMVQLAATEPFSDRQALLIAMAQGYGEMAKRALSAEKLEQ